MDDFERGQSMAAIWAILIFIGCAMMFVGLVMALSHSPAWVRTLVGAGLVVALVGVFLINRPEPRNNVSRETGNVVKMRRSF